MVKVFKVCVIFAVIISLAGCATILKPKSTEIQINSEPQGASVYLDGTRVGKTPLTTTASEKIPLTLSLRKEGYEEVSKRIGNHTIVLFYVVDILFWPGLVLDAITGNANTLNEKKLNFTLEPISPTEQVNTKK